jgi:hypothetical protein
VPFTLTVVARHGTTITTTSTTTTASFGAIATHVPFALAVVAGHGTAVAATTTTTASSSTSAAIHAGFLGIATFLAPDWFIGESLGSEEILLLSRKCKVAFTIAARQGLVGKFSIFVSCIGGDVFASRAFATSLNLRFLLLFIFFLRMLGRHLDLFFVANLDLFFVATTAAHGGCGVIKICVKISFSTKKNLLFFW